MNKKIISLVLAAIIFAAVMLICGCGGKTPDGKDAAAQTAEPAPAEDTAEPSAEPTAEPSAEPTAEPTPAATPTATPEPEPEYEFDPHLYLPILDSEIPQENWDAFHNLCDALRAGETTFECASREAYNWATDSVTLAQLFPAACLKIKAQSDDGSAAFENGVGKITYQIPAEEYVERQAMFEELITGILNEYLEADDNDFEKCLKLYDYMESNFTYNYDSDGTLSDGYVYHTIMTHTGKCIDLAGVYNYLLLQAGVEALSVGGHSPDMDHEWSYLIIDGKGYYSDPTWALKSPDEPLGLYYFLMTAERRAGSGFDMEELTASLLPRYWMKYSSVEFTADDDEYCFPSGSFLISLDEENKIVHYELWGNELERSYAHD